MFRKVAIALVAMTAVDLYFLEGRYIHALQEIDRSVLHFSMSTTGRMMGKLSKSWYRSKVLLLWEAEMTIVRIISTGIVALFALIATFDATYAETPLLHHQERGLDRK